MHSNKKIVLLALSAAFHGSIISMEQATVEEQEHIRKIVGNQAAHISNFARDNDHPSKYMELLGEWLTQQRSTVTEDKAWNLIVEHLGKTVSFCGCRCVYNETTQAVKNVFIQIASELKPGESCSKLLIERSQEAIENVYKLRFYRNPALGNGLGADWYPSSPTCHCKGYKKQSHANQ